MSAAFIDAEARPKGPTFWFVKLDLALEEGDWSAAAQAADELRRLGIDVRVRLDRDRPEAVEAATC